MATAWIFEESDDHDHTRATGRFSSSLQGEDVPGHFEEGPRWASIDEVLAWARARTERIVVRYMPPLGQPFEYSAGTVPVWDDQPLPQWPPPDLDLRPRRSGEFGYLDRAESDEPIAWAMIVAVTQGWGEPVPEFAAAFVERLRANEGVEVVGWVPLPGGGYTDEDLDGGGFTAYMPLGNETVRVQLTTAAATLEQAETRVCEVGRSITTRLLEEFGVEERDDDFGWTVTTVAYPAGSDLARWNLHLRAPDDADE